MNRITKNKITNLIITLFNSNKYSFFKALVILVIVILVNVFGPDTLKGFFQINTVLSVSIVFIISSFTAEIILRLHRKTEDAKKLEIDYNKLVNRYAKNETLSEPEMFYKKKTLKLISFIKKHFKPKPMIIYKSSVDLIKWESSKITDQSAIKKGRQLSSCTAFIGMQDPTHFLYVFPVEKINPQYNVTRIVIIDSTTQYSLPDRIMCFYDTIFQAHEYSYKYNSQMIRLDKVMANDNEINIHTSRTTYYDSLVSNRAMDYEIKKYLTVRELCEPGPRINSLDQSNLSNHIGFHLILLTSDGKVVLIKRYEKEVSIAKNTLGIGVAGALKSKFALESGAFLCDGLLKGVMGEMKDELGIDDSKLLKPLSIQENFISLYRDYLEGGKPQFLFHAKLSINSITLIKSFNEYISSKESENKIDGNRLVLISIEALRSSFIAPDLIVYKENRRLNKYEMFPTMSSSLVMYLQYLRYHDGK